MAKVVPVNLAKDLIDNFYSISLDYSTASFSNKISAGKFVETSVQVLQFLETGEYSHNPKVDSYLRSIESRSSTLDDNLKLCIPRVLRSMYTMRNKRSIAHKNDFDPSLYDLKFLYYSAQWVLTDVLRHVSSVKMCDAGDLVLKIQAPVNTIVEKIENKNIVHAKVSTREEICLILKSIYPQKRSVSELCSDLDRKNQKTVKNNLNILWNDKIIEGCRESGYMLTVSGLRYSDQISKKINF
ncbi:hypothetical protein [Halobacteriovorax sp. BALOs_7]|uniref:hypothetical protein n=1 Tax=Halobacteriovorax sp. BALOs_7 TaxID=2109558 RepID=UPI0013C4E84A|nr:hypothetical protein [Halobacteriovorax sp. BALOs_7]